MTRKPRPLTREHTLRFIPVLPGRIQIGDIVGQRRGELPPIEVRVFYYEPGWKGQKLFVELTDDSEIWALVDVDELIPADEWGLLKAMKGVDDVQEPISQV